MKKLFLLSALLLVSVFGLAQTTHTLTANDHYFDPDTLYMQAGDTVELISIGYHGATEVDSLDWVNNTANHNGGFWAGFGSPTSSTKFTIDIAGTYYNICSPHAAMGMKSIIIVGAIPTDIDDSEPSQDLTVYPNPASHSIRIRNSSSFKIYNMEGQLVLEKDGLGNTQEVDVSSLSKGIYNLVLDGGNRKLIIR